MSRSQTIRPKKQSRRVAAWIYVVINPVVDSLGRELELLNSGNLTWRSYSGRCEVIRTIQEYVDPLQWPNYYDFLSEHAGLKDGFTIHDSRLERLSAVAKETFDWLLSW